MYVWSAMPCRTSPDRDVFIRLIVVTTDVELTASLILATLKIQRGISKTPHFSAVRPMNTSVSA